jgi:hypothetical protein
MLGLASFAALCLVVFGLQGWLAMRLARRRRQWSRWKSAGLGALVIPILLFASLILVYFGLEAEHATFLRGALDIFAMAVAAMVWAGLVWLTGAAIAWALLAWKRLPCSHQAIAETFE